jgi:hypothetical protein
MLNCQLHRKVLKRLERRCPECDAILLEVKYSENNNGIIFDEKIIECSGNDCVYTERRKNKHRKEEEFEDE